MSCHQSLEILDAIRPDSNDMLESEFREAYAHMQECPKCNVVWESRQTLDRSLCRVMLDVPVPETLRGRLEESLGITLGIAPEESQTENEDPAEKLTTVPLRSRRRLLVQISAALSTALLVTFAAWIFWNPKTVEPLTLNELVAATPLDATEYEKLSNFDNSFKLDLPKIWKKRKGIVFDSPAKGFSILERNDGSQSHIAALYRFKVKDRQGNIVVGYLLAIPESELADPPQLSDFDPDQSSYVPSLMFNRVAWTQKDLKMTYIAFVPAGHKVLESIQHALPNAKT